MANDNSFGSMPVSLDDLPAVLRDLCSAIAAEIDAVCWSEPDDCTDPEGD